MHIGDFIIIVYIKIDDLIQQRGYNFQKCGRKSKLSDAEVITMEIIGEFLGFGSDKAIYEYFKNHWIEYFPNLGHRTSFVRQSANLWKLKEALQQHIVELIQQNSLDFDTFLCDGFPISTCHKKRVNKKNPLICEGKFGYCAAKDEYYFGFKGHILTTKHGLIINFSLAAANIDEREIVQELVINKIKGTLIADKGLISPILKENLKENNIDLQTPLKKNMIDTRSRPLVKKLMSTRRKIETVISQLTERFKIQRIKAKNMWHLCTKIGRKILSHTMAYFISGSTKFDEILG